MTETTMPLAGRRVIEIGHSVAAPYAGLILGEMGAEVIKVERPGGGDDARAWGPPFHDDMSALFHALNRGKRSVTLDLKSAEGVRRLKALARVSDVVIQNLKPGLADRLGIGAGAMRALNPRLIYANIHAFGDRGPLADRPGYDPLMQAFGGPMSVTGEPGRPAVRAGVSIIDMGTAMWLAMAVITALMRRAETGEGSVVDTSLFETSLAWMTFYLPMLSLTGRAPGRAGSGVVMIAPYQGFPTKDGELMIAAGNNALFARLSAALGRPEWARDELFLSNALRVANKPALIELISTETRALSRAALARLLDEAQVPNAPVHDLAEVVAHPQTEALGMVRSADPLAAMGLPIRFDGERPGAKTEAPALGADNDWLEGFLNMKAGEP